MTIKKTSSTYRWAKLIVGVGILWGFVFIICPAITASSSAFSTMAKFIDASEVESGEFYYTDVEYCSQADLGSRSTFEHMPRSMTVVVK
jgi:hypothetical protein